MDEMLRQIAILFPDFEKYFSAGFIVFARLLGFIRFAPILNRKEINTTVKLLREPAKKFELERPTVIGVTLLSSFGQRTLTEELCVNVNLIEYVSQLTKLALDCELDGVLASASEAKVLRQKFGDDFIIICPAVRPTWSVVNDQIRVVTPTDAVKSGVDYMIIGRPITGAQNPVDAAQLIIDEIEDALAD